MLTSTIDPHKSMLAIELARIRDQARLAAPSL
jgi:hypothetical protein